MVVVGWVVGRGVGEGSRVCGCGVVVDEEAGGEEEAFEVVEQGHGCGA